MIFVSAAALKDLTMSPYSEVATQQPNQAQEFSKLFKTELDNLEFVNGLYQWNALGIEIKIIRRYGRLSH